MYTQFVSEHNKQKECPGRHGANGSVDGVNHVTGHVGGAENSCSQRHKVDSNDNGVSMCPIMSKMADSLQKERTGNGVAKECGETNNTDKTGNTSGVCAKCASCCQQVANDKKAPPVRSASGNYLSQDGNPTSIPGRKTSNISNVSSSGGSDETDTERKLDLRSLIESIGTLLIPVVSFQNLYTFKTNK